MSKRSIGLKTHEVRDLFWPGLGISQSAPECYADTTRLALIGRGIGPGIDNRGLDVYPVTL